MTLLTAEKSELVKCDCYSIRKGFNENCLEAGEVQSSQKKVHDFYFISVGFFFPAHLPMGFLKVFSERGIKAPPEHPSAIS